MNVHDFQVRTLEGKELKLSDHAGKVLLIVNVASHCGFTPQYEGLEALYRRFKDRGFEVLGFPCNQFGAQEPGTEAEIRSFCDLNYRVTFPLFSKIEVNGPQAHPLYRYLTEAKPGLLGTQSIKWNFTKFLVDRKGDPLQRFASADKPESLVEAVEKALSDT